MKIKYYSIPILAVAFFVICSPSASYADDTLVADHGKTVSPIKTNDIIMSEEEVIITIDDHKDKGAVFPLRKAHVKCKFVFKNSLDAPIEALVGFPGNKQGPATYSYPLMDFTAVVSNKQYKIQVKKEILKEYKEEDIQEYRNWYTWKMAFPANSTILVENSYYSYLSAPSGYGPFYLTYELATGANWKGKIGSAVIKAIYKTSDDLEKRVCGIKPKGWTRSQNQIVWMLKDIEPTERDNIEICERNLGLDYKPEEQKSLLFKK